MIERRTWNVVQLSLGFFFIFSAFNSQGAIEETVINNSIVEGVTIKKHDGYIRFNTLFLLLLYWKILQSGIDLLEFYCFQLCDTASHTFAWSQAIFGFRRLRLCAL
jgi:hypothetical protein